MNIGIHSAPLVTGHKNRGIGIYTQCLIDSLKKNTDITVTLFTHAIPKQLDVVHYTYFDPFFLTLPLASSVPTVVTVHDMIPLVFPKHFPSGIRGKIKWQIQKYALQQKHAIITDSEQSKKDIIRICDIPQQKITTIPLAPSIQTKSNTNIRKKYALPDSYMLYVGDINWNKNIPGLLQAALAVNIPLVLVGKAFETYTIHQKNVLILGYVDASELPALYSNAAVCVFPSFYEGFGLPIVEAMACGSVVVCSKAGSLAETAGPAAIIVDPYSHHSIVNGIQKALSVDSFRRKTIIAEGVAWSKQFTWEKTARSTLEVYKKVQTHV